MAKFKETISFKNKLLFFFMAMISYILCSFANGFTYGIAKENAEIDSAVAHVIALCNAQTVQSCIYFVATVLMVLFYMRYFMFKRYTHKRIAAGIGIIFHIIYFATFLIDRGGTAFTTVAILTALVDVFFIASNIVTSIRSQIQGVNMVIKVVTFVCSFTGVVIFFFILFGFEVGIYEILIINILLVVLYSIMCIYYMLPRNK